MEFISSVFTDHSGMKPETNYRKKTEKKTNTWYLIRKQFYANKSDNLEKVDKFLETYSLLRLSQEETDNNITYMWNLIFF